MSIITKNIILEGSKGKEQTNTLFDGGASHSCIQKNIAEKLAILETLPEMREFGTADEKTKLEVTQRISIDFFLNGDRFSDEFFVIEGLSEKAIIGASTMQKWRMKLDYENDDVIYDPKITRLRI
ncbi:MAG: retroviral-like aspartic protease [Solirubrobacterales bacterium]|nr:retroviral-like aspartic protease [Solirubrobacterales bacterium]